MSTTVPMMLAEDILPGHPDRLADAVAESIVDAAVAHDPDALAGVEVGVHRDVVFVTGRVAAGAPGRAIALDLDVLVHDVYRRAGYTGAWHLAPRVEADLDIGPLTDAERAIRRFSDDQSLVTGYACAHPLHLPPAVLAARRLRESLSELRARHPGVLGPDGKVMVRLTSTGDPRRGTATYTWNLVNIALQHREGASFEELHALVLPQLADASRRLDATLHGLAASWSADVLRLNGAGDFSCGGPHGDNGLSGKKLVVDFYGPGVPIGGGAMCGKDPHKVDRVGALRARQLAVRVLEATGAGEVLVTLGWVPGLEAPALVGASVDGVTWDGPRVLSGARVHDLSIETAFVELELAAVRWRERLGHSFGGGESWER